MFDIVATTVSSSACLGALSRFGVLLPGSAQAQLLTQLVLTFLRQNVFGPYSSDKSWWRQATVLGAVTFFVTYGVLFAVCPQAAAAVGSGEFPFSILLSPAILGIIQVAMYMLSPRGSALICKYVPFLSSWIRHIHHDILVRTEEELKEVQERIAKLKVQIDKKDKNKEEEEVSRLKEELVRAEFEAEALFLSVRLLNMRDQKDCCLTKEEKDNFELDKGLFRDLLIQKLKDGEGSAEATGGVEVVERASSDDLEGRIV